MGFITDCAISSLNVPLEGGNESGLIASNAIGVDTFTALASPSFTSALYTLVMAGTSFEFRSGLERNTLFPRATPWISVAG
jgi:hypothetical protein